MAAELLLGEPLFPGDSGVDQLVEIIKVREGAWRISASLSGTVVWTFLLVPERVAAVHWLTPPPIPWRWRCFFRRFLV